MKKVMLVFLMAISMFAITGCNLNYVHNLEYMESYNNVEVKAQDNSLYLIINDKVIELGYMTDKEMSHINEGKKYNVYVDDNRYYFEEIK